MWCVVLGATEAPPASPDSLVASPDAQRVAVGGSGSKAVTLTVSGTGRQVAYCTAQDRAGNTAPVVTSGAFGVGVHSDGSSPWLYVGLGAAGLVLAAVVVAGIWRYRRPAPAPAAIPIDAEDAPAMGVADSAPGKPAAAAASATVSIPAISLYASSPHNSLAQAMTLHAEAYVQQCRCVCPCYAGAPCSPFGVCAAAPQSSLQWRVPSRGHRRRDCLHKRLELPSKVPRRMHARRCDGNCCSFLTRGAPCGAGWLFVVTVSAPRRWRSSLMTKLRLES